MNNWRKERREGGEERERENEHRKFLYTHTENTRNSHASVGNGQDSWSVGHSWACTWRGASMELVWLSRIRLEKEKAPKWAGWEVHLHQESWHLLCVFAQQEKEGIKIWDIGADQSLGSRAHALSLESCRPSKRKDVGTFSLTVALDCLWSPLSTFPVRGFPRQCWGNARQSVRLDPHFCFGIWHLYGTGPCSHSLSRQAGLLSQPVAGSPCHVLCGLKWEIGEDMIPLFSGLNSGLNNLCAQKVPKAFFPL